MSVENLEELIECYKQDRVNSRNIDKLDFFQENYIEPFLELLGWDIKNKKEVLPQDREVIKNRTKIEKKEIQGIKNKEKEKKEKEGRKIKGEQAKEKVSRKGKESKEKENQINCLSQPDYTFTRNGVVKFFLEAREKSIDITKEKEISYQARLYGWNAKHKITILTNFEYLFIYDVTRKPEYTDSPKTSLYRSYHYSEYIEKLEEIKQMLSYESVYSGAYDRFVMTTFAQDGRTIVAKSRIEVEELFLTQMNQWRIKIGSYLYYKKEKYKSIPVLNDVIQEFINQMVFLRICENRKMPLHHKLNALFTKNKQVKSELNQIFELAQKCYGSELFRENNILCDLEEQIVSDIVKELYDYHSPYLFHIMDTSLFGKIYEAFLTEALIVNEDGTIQLERKREYKHHSIVTTPYDIVKFMVQQTLEPQCRGKNPADILKLKIADIACGAGIFLEESFSYLMKYCIRWYQTHNKEELITLENGMQKLPFYQKKQLLCSCIYGLDIDIHAVEAAKFSLFLKLIEDEEEESIKNETKILPDMEDNIYHGNALVSYDDLQEYEEEYNCEISYEEQLQIAPFDWNLINKVDLFDVILGNPPYVSTEDMHLILSDIELTIYKKKYQSAYKQYDKYYLFVEHAWKKLKEDGVLCYIIPNKFIKIVSGKELRNMIGKYVSQLDDFGDGQIFPDKNIYVSIVTINKQEQEEFLYTNWKSSLFLWEEQEKESIKIKNETLKELPWQLSTDIAFMKMMHQLKQVAVPLSKHANIFNGIQTSAERPEPIYWFSTREVIEETDTYYKIQKGKKEYNIEKEILKPYFKPTKMEEKKLNSYVPVVTDKRIIFPYDEKGKLIPIQVMRKKYSGTYAYLKDYYDRLVPKSVSGGKGREIPGATKETWYQYGRTQALTAFVNTPKLIVGILSKEPMYAYDEEDMLIASGGTAGYCAISKMEKSPYELEYIQAWLSHPYTEELLQIMGSDFDNGYIARGTFVLSNIPFVELDFKKPEQKAIYDAVVKATKKIYDRNKKISGNLDKAGKSILMREKERLIHTIQENITKVYQLNFK